MQFYHKKKSKFKDKVQRNLQRKSCLSSKYANFHSIFTQTEHQKEYHFHLIRCSKTEFFTTFSRPRSSKTENERKSYDVFTLFFGFCFNKERTSSHYLLNLEGMDLTIKLMRLTIPETWEYESTRPHRRTYSFSG